MPDEEPALSGEFERPPDPPVEVLQERADRPVLRIGDVVRHPRQPASEAVHALLSHLADVGFTPAPRPGPLDGEHDDVEYIEGIAGDDACLLVGTDSAVAAVAELLRRYHDAVEGWQSSRSLTWFDGQTGTGGPGRLVCHGDVGPWNLVWRGAEIVGLIDWEHATVGTRRTDIAYALHYLAPFRDRSYWQGVLGMASKPRRRHRMQVFADAYGIKVDEELVTAVLNSQQAGIDLIERLAARGDARRVQQILDGELDREHRAMAWSRHRHHKWHPRPRPA